MDVITKIGTKPYKLDFATNRITFLDNRFYLHTNGKFYPSATTILDAYPKSAGFYEWMKKVGEDADTIRDEAGRRGSIVHELTEEYDNGNEVTLLDSNGNVSCKMYEWEMFSRYVEFRTRFPLTIELCEQAFVSDHLAFGGTIDRIVTMNGKTLLLDIKTSNAIHNHYWLQMAAYKHLIESETDFQIDGIGILWLNAKTKTDGKKDSVQGKGWQLLVEECPAAINRYFRLFQSTQMLWTEENGAMQPKNLSYSLTHKYA